MKHQTHSAVTSKLNNELLRKQQLLDFFAIKGYDADLYSIVNQSRVEVLERMDLFDFSSDTIIFFSHRVSFDCSVYKSTTQSFHCYEDRSMNSAKKEKIIPRKTSSRAISETPSLFMYVLDEVEISDVIKCIINCVRNDELNKLLEKESFQTKTSERNIMLIIAIKEGNNYKIKLYNDISVPHKCKTI